MFFMGVLTSSVHISSPGEANACDCSDFEEDFE
jgi:hypothetical protein